MPFAELHTRPGDEFAAELRQTATLLLTHAASPQITQLLHGEDEVFLKQSFPRSGRLSAPGWANLWDLLPESSPAAASTTTGFTNKEFAPARATVELVPAAAGVAPKMSRLFLSA